MIFDFIFINKVLIILINLIGIWLAFWVYSADRKSKINRGFFLLVIPNLLWINFYNLACLSSQHYLALLWTKLTFTFVLVFFLSAYYFFVIWFLNKKGWYLLLGKVILIIGLLFSFFCIFTNSIILDIEIRQWGTVPIFSNEGTFIFYTLIVFLTLFIICKLIIEYFRFSKEQKFKIQYFLIGVFIFTVINFIFGVILPSIFKIYKYYHLANYATIFLLAFTAYAIVKQELFDIKVVVTSIFVGLIAILLASDALLFTEVFSIQILKGVALLIFLIFGHMLIKSVAAEVKRREELEKLSRAKSEFISMASHQLRTPLTAIKGYSSLMLEGTYGNTKEKQKRVLKNIFVSTERLLKIVNDLLNLSRIELGKMDVEKEPVKIERLVESVCEEMKPKVKEKGIKLIFSKPKKVLPEINVDPLKIRQVIFNLIDNAIKYTEKGEIKIEIEKAPSKIQIIISDTGKGFTEEEKHRMFELFVRGEAGIDTFVEGTGIGLNVARKFVELHGGKVRAESQGKDKGSTFYIELPITSKSDNNFIKNI